jgi:hypothetical protein
MIMHFSPEFINHPTLENKERIINFNSKTALSCAEALLFYSGKFVTSYKKRSDILNKTFFNDFLELSKIIPDLPKIVEKYTNHKLKPTFLIKDYISDWFELRDYSEEILKFLIFKFTGKKSKDVIQLAKIINRNFSSSYIQGYIRVKFSVNNKFLLKLLSYPANFVLNVLYSKKIYDSKKRIYLMPLLHPFTPPDLKIFPAAILIISSLNLNGTMDKKLFEESKKYFKQIYFEDFYKSPDWEKMRINFGTAFTLYGFQRII